MNFKLKILFFIIFLPVSSFASNKQVEEKEKNSFVARAAVVDVESILEHSEAIMDIKKSIAIIREQIKNELSTKEIKLKKAEAELIEQRGVLPKEEFEALVSAFNKRVSSTQKEMQLKKSALEQAHAGAISEVHKNTIAVISDLSKKYGFNIVFPSSQVLYVNNALNITHEVISNLNERLKVVEVNYHPSIDK
jgi:Skp family chaperone for outer membrane proteins